MSTQIQRKHRSPTDRQDWDSILEVPAPWHVFHVRSRTEKVVCSRADAFQGGIVRSILPTWTRSERYQRRLVQTHLPLFPGYVFGRSDEEAAREFAYCTKEIVSCLKVHDQNRFMASMSDVSKMITLGDGVAPESRVHQGMEVEIVSGPLEGLKGRVVRELSSMRFILTIDMLHLGASVEVSDSVIEPVR